MARRRRWETLKGEVLEMLEEDRLIGYLDPGIAGILRKINSLPLVATTSSCIGRITFIAGRRPWSRGDSLIAYKTHTMPDPVRIDKVLARPFRDLWIKATGPILHARTPSIDCASHILDIFRPHGFKHSGLISLDPDRGYTVEVMSGVDVTTPIRLGGSSLIQRQEVAKLAVTLYSFIEEARMGLKAAVEELTLNPGACAGSTSTPPGGSPYTRRSPSP